MRQSTMTIITQKGGSLPYNRDAYVLLTGEQFEEDKNGKEIKKDQRTGMEFKGNLHWVVIWAMVNGDGKIIGKYAKESHLKSVIKLINDAYDEGEDYFVVPSQKEFAILTRRKKNIAAV